ncbi:MAG TPA: Xaa-Pro peptidase family protein [Chloroflexota bacterium]|nr:Xaa-Pro peptidase family protein [Chloroflexota bacterium]
MASIPFNADKLTSLLQAAGLDAVVATSRHNVRYLAGYVDHFHERAPRGGTGQYIPAVGIARGRYDAAFYVGGVSEKRQLTELPIWIPEINVSGGPSTKTAEVAAGLLKGLVGESATIGVELPFLPADAYLTLQSALPHARLVDATNVLHELRAIKTPAELARIEKVANLDAGAINAAFRAGTPGITTREMSDLVRRDMENAGMDFLWSFTCAGPSYLRAPSEMAWWSGQILHLDCGGEIDDYLADICRVGSLGEPSSLARDLHRECLALQDEVRQYVKPGTPYRDLLLEGERALKRMSHGEIGRFVAHGIGMVSHEQPMISATSTRPLEAGMVLSIETEFHHPEVGHMKIEDVVAVTPDGYVGYGDLGREITVVAVG